MSQVRFDTTSVIQAINQHGYSQMEVARHLPLHYSTVSRLIKGVTEQQR
jgi:hypothetical protein